MVGRQTPLLALVVPLILVGMVDGARGIRQAWPAAVVGGLAFAIGQFVCSNYISVELTDIVASLLSAGSIVALLQVWSPSEPLHGETNGRGPRPAIAGAAVADADHRGARSSRKEGKTRDTTRRDRRPPSRPTCSSSSSSRSPSTGRSRTGSTNAGTELAAGPGSTSSTPRASAPTSLTFKFGWPNAAGTLLLVAGPADHARAALQPGARDRASWAAPCTSCEWATLTVATVLALAYVMNLSGPDDHARPVDRRRVRHPAVPVRRSSAGSAWR